MSQDLNIEDCSKASLLTDLSPFDVIRNRYRGQWDYSENCFLVYINGERPTWRIEPIPYVKTPLELFDRLSNPGSGVVLPDVRIELLAGGKLPITTRVFRYGENNCNH